MNRRGFSIVEIMGIASIIGVLIAMAKPPLIAAQVRARETSAVGYLGAAMAGLELFRGDYSMYPPGTQWKANIFPQGRVATYVPVVFYMDCNNTTNASVPPGYTGGLLPNGYVCQYKGDSGTAYNEYYFLKLRPKTNLTGKRVFVVSNIFDMRHCLGLDTNIANLMTTAPLMATLDQPPAACPP